MAIMLPPRPKPQSATMRLLDFGSDMQPVLGGALQRVSRLGNRHAMDVQMPPMRYPDAMAWIQRLKRGRVERVIMEVTQPDFSMAEERVTVVNQAVSGGNTIKIQGLLPSFVLKEGQFLSILFGPRNYLYSIDADQAADLAGVATVTITPMLRTPLSAGSPVRIFPPVIEGALSGDEFSWNVDIARMVGLSFTVTEAE